jgi:uncharacterized protein
MVQPSADQQQAAKPSPAVNPTAASRRFESIDTLRGFALLGILGPNIIAFAWPMAAMTDYTVIGDTPANRLAHTITATVFLGKFMFLFALLFGSGVIMYARKFDTADESGKFHSKLRKGAGLWYARCAWLLLFGLLHAYGLWYGDILTYYAIAGLTLMWWIRRLNPQLQFWGGLTVYYIGSVLLISFSALGYWALSAGKITATELSADPAAEIIGYTGTYLDAFKIRFFTTLIMQLTIGVLFLPLLWGIMSMGMGLTRMGILTGQRSLGFYVKAAIVCLGIGIPLTAAGFVVTERTFELVPGFIWQTLAQPVGVPLALGYGALVIALSKWEPAHRLCTPLAAVGRMALTNYFLQTILCTTLFYGYGLGYFASIEYPALWLVVLSVWTINIVFSMFWLRFFTMGPFEWLWRVLTYRRLFSIRA